MAAWGGASDHSGRLSLGFKLVDDVVLAAEWAGSSASSGDERRAEQVVALAIDWPRGGIALGRRVGQASFDPFRRDLSGSDARGWVDLGTPLDAEVGLRLRRSEVVERGAGVLEKRYVVGGYEFVSPRRFQYLQSTRHDDVEVDLAVELGRFRVTGVVGRGFSEGEGNERAWSYVNVATPLTHGWELVMEGGRTGGVPETGREPGGFARMGFRLDLGHRQPATPFPAEPPPKPAAASTPVADLVLRGPVSSLLIDAPGAAHVELRGDFTAWEVVAMTRQPSGRWALPVVAGVHRFNIRIDQADWGVPSGLPVVEDEFFGAPVAVLVVPARGTGGRLP